MWRLPIIIQPVKELQHETDLVKRKSTKAWWLGLKDTVALLSKWGECILLSCFRVCRSILFTSILFQDTHPLIYENRFALRVAITKKNNFECSFALQNKFLQPLIRKCALLQVSQLYCKHSLTRTIQKPTLS